MLVLNFSFVSVFLLICCQILLILRRVRRDKLDIYRWVVRCIAFCFLFYTRQGYHNSCAYSLLAVDIKGASVALDYRKINSLSSGKVRSIGDIIYFVTAVPQEDAADE